VVALTRALPAVVCLLLALAAPASAAESMPGCAQPDHKGGDWKTYGKDWANSRTQQQEKVISIPDVPTLASQWVFSSQAAGGEGDFTGTPTVSNGCMYVASTRGWVFAVNADTGKLAWKYQLPYGGSVNSTVTVADREVKQAVRGKRRVKRCRKGYVRAKKGKRRGKCVRRQSRRRSARRRARRAALLAATTTRKVGTVYVAVSRTSESETCAPGEKAPCVGPYVAALDQATGKPVFITAAIDQQPGADVYGTPLVYDNMVMIGVSGGSAELGDEADRIAFQGSLNFLDATSGELIRKTYTIHPPNQPEDDFAGGAIWSTPAIDAEEKVAYAGTGNPFRPQAEHPNTNAVLKFDIDRESPTFGQIIGSYKGNVDEYIPQFSELPCYDFPGNNPPFYPQGLGSCGDIDMDFGSSPNLFKDAGGRKLVGAGQKSGVYHVFDAKTMEPVWSQIVGPPGAFGGIVGSTAYDGQNIFGPITIPGYVWSISGAGGGFRWAGAVGDGLHWGPPVSVANGVVYTVDFNGFLDAYDARTGALLVRRPLIVGGGGPLSLSWGGVSIARNTIYAAVGVLGLADGFVAAFRPGSLADLQTDLEETGSNGDPGGGDGGGDGGDGGDGGGGGGGAPVGPSVVSGPGGASYGYLTPVVVMPKGSPLTYANGDIVQHDVVGDNGQFRSKLIGLGETAPVEGAEKLQVGAYGFFCSVHPGMRGTLVVQ